MFEQQTGCVVLAVVYPLGIETQTWSSINGDKRVWSVIVRFVEDVAGIYIARVDVVVVIPGNCIHRPASHETVVVPRKQPYFLTRKICRGVDSIWVDSGCLRSGD